jgi:hypothetical protein
MRGTIAVAAACQSACTHPSNTPAQLDAWIGRDAEYRESGPGPNHDQDVLFGMTLFQRRECQWDVQQYCEDAVAAPNSPCCMPATCFVLRRTGTLSTILT